MKKSKIIILGKIPPPYMGTSVWFDILIKSSIKESFNIQWFNVNVHRELSGMGRMSIRSILHNIKLYISFYKCVKKFGPGLVLIPISQQTIGFIKDSIFILIACKRSKTLIMLHGSNLTNWLDNSPKWLRKYFYYIMKKVKGAIVLGEKLKYIFKPWFSDEMIFVVPNGSNYSLPLRDINSAINVVYFANFIETKGFFELLESIKILSKLGKSTQIKYLAAGNWPHLDFKNKCYNYIEKERIDIKILPPITGVDKLQFLVDSDIFVFTPNKPEGHPWVIVEAMAAGLPIISTDQGAITESVIDGINGFIVDSYSPVQIAEKIEYLINNSEIRRKMGEESRRLYETHFTEKIMIDKLINVFNTVIGDE